MFRDTALQDRPLETLPPWRRHRKALLIALAVASLGGAFVSQLHGVAGVRSSVAASRLAFGTAARTQFVRDFSADGKIIAASSPMLYAPAAGTVVLRVHAGDAVSRNQVLAVVDSPDLVARLSQERATLQGLSFDLGRARLEAERAADEAHVAMEQAQIDHRTAEREFDRSHKAYERGAYSLLEMTRAEDALDKAGFRLSQAERTLLAQPRQSRFDVQGREALVERQRVLVEDLQRQVAALDVRTPFDGQVGQVPVADRANVPRDAPLLSVVDLSNLEVEIQVPESFARDLATGVTAELSGNGKTWNGTVSAVSPEVVDGQVVARVRLGAGQPEGLRQNQRLTVRVLLENRNDVLSVERGSFLDEGGAYLYRVRDDVAVRTPVRLGAISMTRVEVLEGLAAGDRIVISGTDLFEHAERVLLSR